MKSASEIEHPSPTLIARAASWLASRDGLRFRQDAERADQERRAALCQRLAACVNEGEAAGRAAGDEIAKLSERAEALRVEWFTLAAKVNQLRIAAGQASDSIQREAADLRAQLEALAWPAISEGLARLEALCEQPLQDRELWDFGVAAGGRTVRTPGTRRTNRRALHRYREAVRAALDAVRALRYLPLDAVAAAGRVEKILAGLPDPDHLEQD